MISETSIMASENVPPEMTCRFDQPWVFIGEDISNRPYIRCTCRKCNRRPVNFACDRQPDSVEVFDVLLKGFIFITDDMIECIVYFGVCEHCDTVHWARQGPPFKRARYLAYA